jgi:multidrug transporter EmrE-like cation transporter
MKFLLSINYLAWLVLSAVFFAFGEYLSKKFALSPRIFYVIAVIVVYSLGTLAWLPAILQKNQLFLVGTIWSVLSLAATVLIGLLIFGEKLNIMGTIGVIFAFVAVVFLSLA